ncbi:NAD-P-binding protein [Russula brevipes]|nr:NAD-P-binding protein [Russula brevipes]
MSNFRRFAIVGAGNVGGFIVEELLKQKAAASIDEITIVSRPQNQSFAARGVRIATAEFTDVPALTTALAGTHVVISTISLLAVDIQVPVAQAAKAAGASLFLPSEYGGPTNNLQGLLGIKGALHAKLREVGPPLLLVYTGPFADYSWGQIVNLDVKSGKVAVGGDGNAPISWTARKDIARFLAHVLVHSPASRLQNQTLRLEGDRASFNEIFRGYEERTGTKLDVTYRPVDSLRAKLAENASDFDAYLHVIWATDGLVGEADNGLFPEWNPTKVVDILAPRT